MTIRDRIYTIILDLIEQPTEATPQNALFAADAIVSMFDRGLAVLSNRELTILAEWNEYGVTQTAKKHLITRARVEQIVEKARDKIQKALG